MQCYDDNMVVDYATLQATVYMCLSNESSALQNVLALQSI